MQERQVSTKQEQADLSARMRSEGKTWGEIASAFRERYRVNGRVAMRLAHQAGQKDVADDWNAHWPDDPKTFKNISYWERWPNSTGHQPSLLVLSRLAEVYECSVSDLVADYADYRHLDDASRMRRSAKAILSPGRASLPESIVSDMAHASETHTTESPRPATSARSRMPSDVVAPQTIKGLQGILSAQLVADAMIGSRHLIDPVRSQVQIVDTICRAVRGRDKTHALRFAIKFIEFCGWLHQDAGDFVCAETWTNKALNYAMELGDRRSIAYILMRKSNIATDAGDPATALGLTNAALANDSVLTPRLRAVVLRQRANAHAALISTFGETTGATEFEKDAESAMAEALVGINQQEDDFAPYCTPSYVDMEIGAALLLVGKPEAALPIFEKSRVRWGDSGQARDNALCLARLATAYAHVGDRERAHSVASEAIIHAKTVGSWRIVTQLAMLNSDLAKWPGDPYIDEVIRKLDDLIRSSSRSTNGIGNRL